MPVLKDQNKRKNVREKTKVMAVVNVKPIQRPNLSATIPKEIAPMAIPANEMDPRTPYCLKISECDVQLE